MPEQEDLKRLLVDFEQQYPGLALQVQVPWTDLLRPGGPALTVKLVDGTTTTRSELAFLGSSTG